MTAVETNQHDLGDEDEPQPMPPHFPQPSEDSTDGQIAHMTLELRRLRLKIAGLAKGLAYRELDGRSLRNDLEFDFRKTMNKTDAEKAAKDAPEYRMYCRDTAQMEHRKAEAEATAECARLLIQARIATLMQESL